jgi:hypothetical protein
MLVEHFSSTMTCTSIWLKLVFRTVLNWCIRVSLICKGEDEFSNPSLKSPPNPNRESPTSSFDWILSYNDIISISYNHCILYFVMSPLSYLYSINAIIFFLEMPCSFVSVLRNNLIKYWCIYHSTLSIY